MSIFLSHYVHSRLLFAFTILLCLLLISGCAHKPAATIPAPQTVAEVANRAADWQLAHMESFAYVRTFRDHTENPHGWVQGAFFVGLNRWAEHSQNADYLQALVAKGESNKWKLGDKSWHADDQVIGFTYAAVAARTNNLALIAPTQKIMKDILGNRATDSLEYQPDPTGQGEATCQRRWCWCDALWLRPCGQR
jgi:rhamnogalacturonyl hydrolase YesR